MPNGLACRYTFGEVRATSSTSNALVIYFAVLVGFKFSIGLEILLK
ncbi:hypothetical protein J4731_02810 [Providencia rettgeri]|nr:hypothetical protein [Providencia rettgeri]